MKVISYSVDNGLLSVVTDNPGRSVFVYPVGWFSSLKSLLLEIERSISLEARRKASKEMVFFGLKSDLDAEISKSKEGEF